VVTDVFMCKHGYTLFADSSGSDGGRRAKQHANFPPQQFWRTGLGEKTITARSPGAFPGRLDGRQDNDRDVLGFARPFQTSCRFPTVESRHQHIHHNHIGPAGRSLGNPFQAIGRGHDPATHQSQVLVVNGPGVRVVVDDQHKGPTPGSRALPDPFCAGRRDSSFAGRRVVSRHVPDQFYTRLYDPATLSISKAEVLRSTAISVPSLSAVPFRATAAR
jgi:hypothetical protein